MHVRRTAYLIGIALLVACGSVRADPVVITSGSVGGSAHSEIVGWQLFGMDTALFGENFGSSAPFESGMVVDFSRQIAIRQNPAAPVSGEVVRGATYNHVLLQGEFSFSTPSFVAPVATASENLSFRTFTL